jgi:hypothetical protein
MLPLLYRSSLVILLYHSFVAQQVGVTFWTTVVCLGSKPITRFGTRGWALGGNSYVIMAARTPVWSFTGIPQPTQRTAQLLLMPCSSYNQEPLNSCVPDFVICSKHGPHPGFHWHCLSPFLTRRTGLPWCHAHWVGESPNSIGTCNWVRSEIVQREDNWHVRWELFQRCSEGSGQVYSKASQTRRRTT